MSKISFLLFLTIAVLLLLPAAGSAQNAPTPAEASSAPNMPPGAPPADDWTTWGYDQQRTGWNRGETTLTKSNVSKLEVQWSAQLSTPVTNMVLSTLTAPVVVAGVRTPQGPVNMLFLLSDDNTVFALDADSGKVLWQKSYPNPDKPARPDTWLCPNVANDTPVIDKARNFLFFITSDGKLRGLNLSDGAERMTPMDFIPPFTRAWSLNLIDNVVYTTNGRGCGGAADANSAQVAATAPERPGGPAQRSPLVPAAVSAMDVSDPTRPRPTSFYTSGGRPAGPWGRGGVAEGPDGAIITQTADGPYDPAAGEYGESVLKLAPKVTRLMDSFTPENWKYLNVHDLDMGSASSDVFTFQNRTLVAVSSKEGVLFLLDNADLGGGPPNHSTPLYKSPQLGNDAASGIDPGQGVWGAVATYETPDGKRFLYLPMWGPPSKNAPPFKYANGPIANGSIMAFQVTADGGKVSLVPQWTSPNMIVPDAPVVANGVVYAIQTGEQTLQNPLKVGVKGFKPSLANNAQFRATPVSHLILYAFDAETGKQLYSSDTVLTNWVHFSEPVVALGKVFVVTHDAHVYAFGVKR
jgi:outer membrane protein assembly factor BamB